jgi:pimeloyl-ACP methyl ester carboxylesterase
MSVTLSYKSLGSAGPPVVILHGLLGSSSNWGSIARRLAERHRVFALDLRNHGESPHIDDMSYAAMADDVRAFLDDHDIDAATVIGHSMGGKTAMRLALDTPHRVDRLVVVDIAPTLSDHDHLPWLRAMACLDVRRITRRADAESMLEAAVPDAAMRRFLLQNLAGTAGGFAWRINLEAIENSLPALLDFPIDANLQPFTGSTLFVRGAQSDYLPPKDETVIRELFPRARIVTIEGAGHWVHAEQPARFLEALDETLDNR